MIRNAEVCYFLENRETTILQKGSGPLAVTKKVISKITPCRHSGLDPESSAFSYNYWIPVFTGMTNHIDLAMKSLVIAPMGLVNFCPLGLRGESKQFCALINNWRTKDFHLKVSNPLT